MTPCPKCGGFELRVHGSRAHAGFRRRWRFFGHMVPRIVTRAVDVSCAACLYAFVIRPEGVTEAPLQTAYDNLKAAQNRLQAQANGPAPAPAKDEADEPRPPIRAVPRPAPDPRVRRR